MRPNRRSARLPIPVAAAFLLDGFHLLAGLGQRFLGRIQTVEEVRARPAVESPGEIAQIALQAVDDPRQTGDLALKMLEAVPPGLLLFGADLVFRLLLLGARRGAGRGARRGRRGGTGARL